MFIQQVFHSLCDGRCRIHNFHTGTGNPPDDGHQERIMSTPQDKMVCPFPEHGLNGLPDHFFCFERIIFAFFNGFNPSLSYLFQNTHPACECCQGPVIK